MNTDRDLQSALDREDLKCFNPPWKDFNEEKYEEEIENFIENTSQDEQLFNEILINDDSILGHVRGLYKSAQNRDQESFDAFTSGLVLAIEIALREYAEKKVG